MTIEPVRIELTSEQAAELAAHGDTFCVIGRAGHPGNRLTLWALPCSVGTGDAACSVAKGEARAVRLRAMPANQPKPA